MSFDSHKGQHPSRRTPVVTWSLIAINVIVFLNEVSLDPEDLERLMYLFGVVPARYTHPDWAVGEGAMTVTFVHRYVTPDNEAGANGPILLSHDGRRTALAWMKSGATTAAVNSRFAPCEPASSGYALPCSETRCRKEATTWPIS